MSRTARPVAVPVPVPRAHAQASWRSRWLRLAAWLWRPLKHRSLVAQIMWLNCLVAGVVSLGVLKLGISTHYSLERGATVSAAQSQAQLVASSLSKPLRARDRAGALETLDLLGSLPATLGAEVFDEQGRSFARHAGAERRAQPAPGGARTLWGLLDAELSVLEPVMFEAEPIGYVVIRTDLAALNAQLIESNLVTLLAQLTGTGSVLLALYLLVPQILYPLQRLTGLMDKVSSTRDYGLRAQVGTRNEVGLLAGQLNGMLEQIQARDASLARLAHYDPVTGLPNRHHFNQVVDRAMQAGGGAAPGVGLLFIDLDNFKTVNDTLGHQAGDELLGAVAGRIGAQLRASDLVCRLGGDEFAVVLVGLLDESDAVSVAEGILQALAAAFPVRQTEVYVGASIGVAVGGGASTRELLVQNADIAMYCAKADGKRTVRAFRPDMNVRIAQRSVLAHRLRRAVDARRLAVHYQPQVDLATQRMVGVEALVRWTDDELGPVGPDVFIPVAEESGLIHELGRWVLQRACRDVQRLHAAGVPDLPVAVNVSARQLAHAGFVQDVAAVLAATGLPARCLELELTESALLEDVPRVRARLAELQGWGVRIAIDDFGSGYSSLRYLKQLPIQRLKIDREFVSNIPTDTGNMNIARAVIGLAHSLGMDVVAEGVETEAQQGYLLGHRCDVAQGYLFSRPVPIEQLVAARAQADVPG